MDTSIKFTRHPNLYFVLVILILASVIHLAESICDPSARSCSSCINGIDDGEDCGWCADQNFVGPRCARLAYLNENRCYNQEKITYDLRLQRVVAVHCHGCLVNNTPAGVNVDQNYSSTSVTYSCLDIFTIKTTKIYGYTTSAFITYYVSKHIQNEPLSTSTKRIAPQQVSLNIKKASGKETEVQFKATAAKRWLATKVSFPRRKYSVTMTSSCRFRWRDSGRGRCSRTRPGQTLTFTIKIRVLDCNNGNGRITVSIPGYTQDKLNIDILSSCPCSCEQNKERNSAVCRGNGHLSCGTCDCTEGYFGQQCECDGYERDTCRARPDSTVCSGRGNCVCGMCECQGSFRGQYCECNDESCEWFNGALCGGSDRGICQCGECTCQVGFIGTACELSMSTDACVAPNGIICNGQGDCIGNRCRCRGEYRGRTCDQCPTCTGQCSILWPCIQCTVFQTGELTPEDCYYQCRQYGITIVDSLDQRESGRLCMFRDDDSCRASFMYMFDEDGELVVEASRSKVCARQ